MVLRLSHRQDPIFFSLFLWFIFSNFGSILLQCYHIFLSFLNLVETDFLLLKANILLLFSALILYLVIFSHHFHSLYFYEFISEHFVPRVSWIQTVFWLILVLDGLLLSIMQLIWVPLKEKYILLFFQSDTNWPHDWNCYCAYFVGSQCGI